MHEGRVKSGEARRRGFPASRREFRQSRQHVKEPDFRDARPESSSKSQRFVPVSFQQKGIPRAGPLRVSVRAASGFRFFTPGGTGESRSQGGEDHAENDPGVCSCRRPGFGDECRARPGHGHRHGEQEGHLLPIRAQHGGAGEAEGRATAGGRLPGFGAERLLGLQGARHPARDRPVRRPGLRRQDPVRPRPAADRVQDQDGLSLLQ